MRRVAGLALAVLAGCVLQTETVSGPTGEKGAPGEPGPAGSDSPWVAGDGGAIYYPGGHVGVGTTDPEALLTVRPVDEHSGSPVAADQDKVFVDGSGPSNLINVGGPANSSVGVIFSRPGERGVGNVIYDHGAEALYFSTAAAERMRITGEGQVGIGTTLPLAQAHVQSGDPLVPALLTQSASGEGNVRFHFAGDGWGGPVSGVVISSDSTPGQWSFIKGVADYNGTPSTQFRITSAGDILVRGTITEFCDTPSAPNCTLDVAEAISVSNDAIGAGDVVVADPGGGERAALASAPYDRAVLGVVSTRPGIVLGGDASELDRGRVRDPHRRPLALAGRVPVKVTLEGGAIRPGDPLTTSSTPGHAMRAAEPWRGGVIGTALTAFSGKGEDGKPAAEGKVIVFLALDRTPTCNPEEQQRLASKVGELEKQLAAGREARMGLEARIKALESAVARMAGQSR